MSLQFKSGLIAFACFIVVCASPSAGKGPEPAAPLPDQQSGSITGTVVDESGAVVAAAHVKLDRQDPSPGDQSSSQEARTDNNGQFSFPNIAPGPFQLSIAAAGFATRTSSGILHSGENQTVPQITMAVATAITDVEVGLTRTERAAAEIKVEEKQRVLGAIPNFYVSYVPDAAPLNSKQKFNLAWKTILDPFTFAVVAGAAGVEQAQNHFAGYGQGAQGYGKRFGAGYADTVAGTFIGGALLPSLLKQDPRYFYKGTGSKESRFMYAIANSFICKGDNGRWQANYSNVIGSLAAGGISNIYYPAQDRNGAGLTFENGAIGIGVTAVDNLFQEFLIRKLSRKPPGQANPQAKP